MKTRTPNGFTVIDLMTTLAVSAVLLSLAAPSFRTLTLDNRITTQTNEFLASLALARSEALKRVDRVTVCRSSDGTSCAGSGGWEQGWIVFADADNDATKDNGEAILQVRSTLDGNNTLRGSTNVAAYVSFGSSGTTLLTSGGAQLGTLVLCDERGAEHGKTVSVSITGRTRAESDTPDSCGT